MDERTAAAEELWRAWVEYRRAREAYDGSNEARANLRAALSQLEVAERRGVVALAQGAMDGDSQP